jgi:hypothetical protein
MERFNVYRFVFNRMSEVEQICASFVESPC